MLRRLLWGQDGVQTTRGQNREDCDGSERTISQHEATSYYNWYQSETPPFNGTMLRRLLWGQDEVQTTREQNCEDCDSPKRTISSMRSQAVTPEPLPEQRHERGREREGEREREKENEEIFSRLPFLVLHLHGLDENEKKSSGATEDHKYSPGGGVASGVVGAEARKGGRERGEECPVEERREREKGDEGREKCETRGAAR
ncbi:hypothetical protein ACLOJK_027786 [Asimina triloba]